MNKEIKNLLLIGLAIVVVSGVGFFFYNKSNNPQPLTSVSAPVQTNLPAANSAPAESIAAGPQDSALERPDSYVQGPQDAKVTIVEYLDPECEACRGFYPVVKKAMEAYQGKVRLVVRYMAFHSSSTYAIQALEAAGEQGKYWEFLGILFEKQGEWGHRMVPDMTPFFRYATDLGLDSAKFTEDIKNPKHLEKINRDKQDGESLGVRGTPSFFINGQKLAEFGEKSFLAAIEAEIKK